MEYMDNKWVRLGLWVGGCLLVGGVSSILTAEAITTWYATLSKPWFSPPNWLFGPVWTLLYVMMGVAAWRVHSAKANAARLLALRFFVIQLALNFAWSLVFFGERAIAWGLLEIILLWAAIVATVITFWRVDRPAAWLLGPYLAWVSFATVLNAALLSLNR
jgi:benzodiazapine receptor